MVSLVSAPDANYRAPTATLEYPTRARMVGSTANSDVPTVLVVDDDPDVAAAYEMWLGESADVRTVHGAEAALDTLDETVDIVLLDRHMPGRSGDAVVADIRDRHRACMIAAVSAAAPSIDATGPPFDMYLQKPVSRADLVTAVETLQERASYGRTLRSLCALAEKRVALQETKTKAQLRESSAFDQLATEIELSWAELDTERFESAELRRLIA
jgi:two-component system response regulator AdeR